MYDITQSGKSGKSLLSLLHLFIVAAVNNEQSWEYKIWREGEALKNKVLETWTETRTRIGEKLI